MVAIKCLPTYLSIITRDVYVMNIRVVIDSKELLNNYKRLRYDCNVWVC